MRRILVLALVPIALLIGSLPAVAGNWATIERESAGAEPVAGAPAVVVLRVLRHGVTPASWVTGTLTARQEDTGTIVSAEIRAEGEEGRYVVGLTFPEAGAWTWQVTLRELGTDASGTIEVAASAAAADADGLAARLDAALTRIVQLEQRVTTLEAAAPGTTLATTPVDEVAAGTPWRAQGTRYRRRMPDVDPTLLRAARRGDLAAFGQLVAPHAQVLHRLALHLTGRPSDAEDAVRAREPRPGHR